MKNTNLIYLLGAGRSGTTLLATLLNSHPDIFTIGEMLQFFEHLRDHKNCSCGEDLKECPIWQPVLQELNFSEEDIKQAIALSEKTESHRQILKELFTSKTNQIYLNYHQKVFEAILQQHPGQWVLDSSKYIARYLALKKAKFNKIKGIYLVRDVRGVVNSFKKNVQTPKKPLSAILYYNTINFFGQLVCTFDKQVIKIKYEDLVENPEATLAKIYQHIFETKQNKHKLPEEFDMPHIIGGNRMKSKRKIKLRNDEVWKKKFSKGQKILYYLLASPLMLINRYKI